MAVAPLSPILSPYRSSCLQSTVRLEGFGNSLGAAGSDIVVVEIYRRQCRICLEHFCNGRGAFLSNVVPAEMKKRQSTIRLQRICQIRGAFVSDTS